VIEIYPYARAATLWSGILFLGLFFIKNSALCTSYVAEGMEICIKSVIPSLFPYMVLCSLTVSSGLAKYLGRLLSKPFCALFALDGGCAAAVLLGAVAGFPMGAKTAVDSYKNGLCTREEAERVCCFCNNTGPAFLIGGIGIGFFGDARAGVRLYIIQIISAMLMGILLSFGKPRLFSSKKEKIVFSPDISSAVRSSVSAVLTVCGFVIFFKVLNGALDSVLSALKLKRLSPLLFALCEVTSGSMAAAETGSLPLAAFAVGWSGGCVHAQSAGFMISEGLKMKKYLLCKALQGAFCALICVFWQNL